MAEAPCSLVLPAVFPCMRNPTILLLPLHKALRLLVLVSVLLLVLGVHIGGDEMVSTANDVDLCSAVRGATDKRTEGLLSALSSRVHRTALINSSF